MSKTKSSIGIGTILAMILAYGAGKNILVIIIAGLLNWIYVVLYIIFNYGVIN